MKEKKLVYDVLTKQETIIEVELTTEEEEQRLISSLETKKQLLRQQREEECFPYVNRGNVWYKTLTEEQVVELDNWYKAWLDVTDTLIIPQKPEWLR